MGANKRVEAVETMSIELRGKDAEYFRLYKKSEFILKNTDACRRLVLRGLWLWHREQDRKAARERKDSQE